MPLDFEKEDEVWIALEQARAFMITNGYPPNKLFQPDPINMGDYTLWLIERAMDAYRARVKEIDSVA